MNKLQEGPKFLKHLNNEQQRKRILNLDSKILVKGFLQRIKFIETVNAKVGKSSQHKVNTGEALAMLILLIFSSEYQSLNVTPEHLGNMPINDLLGTDNLQASDFNRFVLAGSLERIYHIDCASLYNELVSKSFPALNIPTDTIQELHIDSTNEISYHKESIEYQNEIQRRLGFHHEEDLDVMLEFRKKPIQIKRGPSKKHRNDLNQYSIHSMCDSNGLPLWMESKDGNASDLKEFTNILRQAWPKLRTTFQNLKYLIGDSALCSKESFQEAKDKGVYLVTRIPDRFNVVKESFKAHPELSDIYDQEAWSKKKGSSPKGALIDMVLFEQPVKALLVQNPNLAETKKKTINNQATKELKEIQKKLLKLECKCLPDAQKEVEEQAAKAKYCRIKDIQYLVKEVNSRPGKPSKDPSKNDKKVASVKVQCTVELDFDKIDKAVSQECMYMLVTTDIERKWQMHELLECYKRNDVVETLWRSMKNKKLFLNAIFLQKEERIEGLLWVLGFAIFIYMALQVMIRDIVSKHEEVFFMTPAKKIDPRPTMKTIFKYFRLEKPGLIYYEDGRLETVNYGLRTCYLLYFLGKEWEDMIYSENYKDRLPMIV